MSDETRALVVADPRGLLAWEIPLDRELMTLLATSVNALSSTGNTLPPADCEQIARLLAGHARIVADELERRHALLAEDSTQRPLTEIVLEEARRRLSVCPQPTLTSARNRARLVHSLYERLDRLQEPPRGELTP
ncbi:DUF6415 family natural product biosynthesis protein [Streptomyces sp. ME01-18a]|uniref:DUF6415 family natural product biosynthesis protein n=1 Tax=Streptomyces sp. ME01-18a TaxID=3028669 RepID=UPI0029B1CD53|nr:DUF6415 family natural product biosynthesis protein [Streptomyces sp. ME01-18a]MDX3433904.1 DUF6415 family natural product biosynthesis protein [Streptomyces sp. ME01-18a]